MTKHIVLAGGGHANALALLELTRHKNRGDITLISDGAHTPYSGMLPGYIAGSYRREQCFIDLQKTAAAHNTTFINARITNISDNQLQLANGTNIAYDILSLNVGATPPPPAPAHPNSCAVKPIALFIDWLEQQEQQHTDIGSIAIIGGGAGGIETTLALAHRWREKTPRPTLTLIAQQLLPAGTPAMRRHLQQRLAAVGVNIINAWAGSYNGETLTLDNGNHHHPCDRVIHATAVAAPPWFRGTGLPTDARGFLSVNSHLQSPAADNIYISGDAAAHTPPLPKAGVMAVRQGKILGHNLPIAAGWKTGKQKHFRNSHQALYIIGDGDNHRAVASRNGITLSGHWVWRWKQHLDTTFMNKFHHG